MTNLISKLDYFIYKQSNVTGLLLNPEATLLCIHAILLDRANIPRVYIGDKENIWPLINTCLSCDHNVIKAWTYSNLYLNNFEHKEIADASYEVKIMAQEMIEDFLQLSCGQGKIHYEMARWSPFYDEDIFTDIIAIELDNQNQLLYKKMHERFLMGAEYKAKYFDIYTNRYLNTSHDYFNIAYREKIEQMWQNIWLHQKKYQKNNIINSIVMEGSFE